MRFDKQHIFFGRGEGDIVAHKRIAARTENIILKDLYITYYIVRYSNNIIIWKQTVYKEERKPRVQNKYDIRIFIIKHTTCCILYKNSFVFYDIFILTSSQHAKIVFIWYTWYEYIICDILSFVENNIMLMIIIEYSIEFDILRYSRGRHEICIYINTHPTRISRLETIIKVRWWDVTVLSSSYDMTITMYATQSQFSVRIWNETYNRIYNITNISYIINMQWLDR